MVKVNKKRTPPAVIFAVLVLSVIFTFACVNTLLLSRMIEDIENQVLEAVPEYEDFAKVYDSFLRKRLYLSITVNHDDIATVEEEFAEILGALKIGDTETAKIAKSRLVSALGHLKRLSGFNIDSII